MSREGRSIDTGGGAYVAGSVDTGGGDFVGGDQYKEEHYHFPALATQIPFQAPQLPDQYVERPGELNRLKALLLPREEGAPPPVSRAILHGIAAVGKSVLAAAFARDEEVRRAFPDGVLWVSLGTRPTNLTGRLADWGGALIGQLFPKVPYADERAGTNHLRSLLDRKACLLVVDDAWEREHVEPFLVGGERCLVLITSRRRDVVPGALEIPLDVMRQAEALNLMANWAGEIPEVDRPVATWLAEELNYLPLALELAGAQVGQLGSWPRFRERWEERKLAAIRRGRRPTTKQDSLLHSLELSLDALHEEDRAPYLQLGIFPEDTAFPARAAAALWGSDEDEAEEVLIDLAGQALLAPRAVDGEQWYAFHDVLQEFVIDRLGDTGRIQAHVALVAGYRGRCGGQWDALQPDGYIHDHLARHMAEGGLDDDLYALIDKPWMEVQFRREDSHRAFAGDVALAVEAAGAGESPNWVQLLRCSLLYATLGSLASSIPPQILGVLTQGSQERRARGYAALIQDPETRSSAYRLIGQALLEQGRPDVARSVLGQALAAAAAISDAEDRAQALGDLVPAFLELGDLDQARLMAQAIEDEQVRPVALVAVARALALTRPEEVTALDAAATAFLPPGAEREEETWTIDVGVVIQALLQAGEYDQALGAAELLERGSREFAYADVAQALLEAGDDDRAERLAQQVAAQARRIRDRGTQALVTCEAAKILAKAGKKGRAVALVRRAFGRARKIKEDGIRIPVLAEVASAFAAAEAFALAEAAAESIGYPGNVAHALSELAQALGQAGERDRVLAVADRVDQLAETLDLEEELASILSSIAQALILVGEDARAESVCRQVLAAADEVGILESKVEILQMLTRSLAQVGAIDLAFEMAGTARTGWVSASAARPILQTLMARGDLERAQRVTEELGDKQARLDALTDLAEGLVQAGEIQGALDIADGAIGLAQAASGERPKADTLSKWSQALVEVGRGAEAAAVAGAALRVADTIMDDQERAFALCEVVRALALTGDKDGALAAGRQAVALAAEIAEDERVAVRRMVQLMNWLDVQRISGHPGPLAARAILEAVVKALALGGAYEEALAVVEPIDNEWERAQALGKVPEIVWKQEEKERIVEVATRLVRDASAMEDEASRGFLLMMAIMALAHAGEVDGAMAVARESEPGTNRVILMVGAAGVLADVEDRDRAVAALDQALAESERLEDESRRALDLNNAAEVLIKLEENARASELAGQAWAVARGLDDPLARADALTKVLPAAAGVGAEERVAAIADEVMGILRPLQDTEVEVAILSSLLQAVVDAEHKESVTAVADRLVAIVEGMDDFMAQQETLGRVVRALVQIGEIDRGREVAEMRRSGTDEEATDPLLDVIDELVDEGDFALAVSVAKIVDSEKGRMAALSQIAHKLTDAAEADVIRPAVERVWEMAEPLADSEFQLAIRIFLSKALEQAGERPRAAELATQALTMVSALDDSYDKAEVLGKLARLLMESGQREEALAVWLDGLTQARLASRTHVYHILADGASVLAAMDRGETLWQVYGAIQEVDGWWSAS